MTYMRPTDLPDFSHPPVAEVILSIQFAAVPFRTYHSGKLAEVYADNAVISEHPPLEPIFETFGGGAMMFPPNMIRALPISLSLPVPRYWFQTSDLAEIVQFQPDRLIQNWVKKAGGTPYPRYETLSERFKDHVSRLIEFFSSQGLGLLETNQCEITYVNAISLTDNRDSWSNLADVFRIWSNEYADEQGRALEDATIRYRYILKGQDGLPYGRLHATIEPVVRNSDQQNMVQFTLTARGRPSGSGVAEAFKFLDEGRDAIVRAFASMTRPAMHQIWGRKDLG